MPNWDKWNKRNFRRYQSILPVIVCRMWTVLLQEQQRITKKKNKTKHFRFLTFCFLFCFVFLPVRAHQSNTPRIQSQYPAMGSYPPAPPPPQQNQTQLGAAAAMQYSPYVIYALSQITLFASNEMVRRIQIDCQMTNAMDSRHFVWNENGISSLYLRMNAPYSDFFF